MSPKSGWLATIAVVFPLLFIMSCGDGGGGGGSAPPQTDGGEGSSNSPVNLGVVNTTLTHAAFVGAYGSSYYTFTAGPASGTYTISLTLNQSDLSWSLYNSSYHQIAFCDAYYSASDESCVTPPLMPGSDYYLMVDEWDMIEGSFQLTVSAPVAATAPVANADADQNVKTGSKVVLNGNGSFDPNGDPLTYAWSFTATPIGSAAVLSSSMASQPTFTADLAGTYVVRLVVNDGATDSSPDSVTITASTFNSAPTASAGAPQYVVSGASAVVTLNGSASSDADGDSLAYTWTMTARPVGSAAVLSSASVVSPMFTADVEGTYTVSLMVNDGTVNSAPAAATINAYRKIDGLGFQVIDAEYSKSLDRLIMVAATPKNQLHIYDPVSGADSAVDLNLVPACVSVSPDGLYAAVGHNAWISYVDLSAGVLLKTLPVTADVFDVVLAGNGYVYAFPRIDQWVAIHSVNISTGLETLSSSVAIYARTRAKLHPGGAAMYGADNGLSPADIEKYDISGGTAAFSYDSPYHGDYSMCGDLWMSEDGMRIFTRCGNVFRSSPNRYSSGTTPDDMTYNGALEGLGLIRHLSHAQTSGKVAAVPDNSYSNAAADTEVKIFNYTYLTFDSKVKLPSFVTSSTKAYAGHGRYVFYDSSATKYYVVLQADSASGMLYDYGVVQY